MAGQMEYNYFPVTLTQQAATVRFHDIAEGEFAIGGMDLNPANVARHG